MVFGKSARCLGLTCSVWKLFQVFVAVQGYRCRILSLLIHIEIYSVKINQVHQSQYCNSHLNPNLKYALKVYINKIKWVYVHGLIYNAFDFENICIN